MSKVCNNLKARGLQGHGLLYAEGGQGHTQCLEGYFLLERWEAMREEALFSITWM